MEDKSKTILNDFLSKRTTLQQFGESMNSLLNILLHNSKISIHSIHFRVKEESSLKEKIEKKNKYESISDITDIIGLRVITYYSSDTDKVEEIIKSEFSVDVKNTIDKRKTHEPDRFGYMSLHYVVSLNKKRLSLPEYENFKGMKFEIQIRTILQHTWAEIEHDLGYKSKTSVPTHIRRKFSMLSGTLELIDGAFIDIKESLSDYVEKVRHQLENADNPDIATNNEQEITVGESDINDILVKKFVLESKVMDSLYSGYLSQKSEDDLENLATLYPDRAKSDQEVSFSTIVEVLRILDVKNISELIKLAQNISTDTNILKTIYTYLPSHVSNKILSRYFFFLFCLYCYAYKSGKMKDFEGFGGFKIIKQIADKYKSITEKKAPKKTS